LAGPGERGREYHFMRGSTDAIAVDHMSLAAMAEGLGGTCWIGAFHEDQVKKIPGIPENILVVVVLLWAYPAEAPASKPRKELEEVVAYDGWRSCPLGFPFLSRAARFDLSEG